MTGADLERHLLHLETVAAHAGDDWARGCAASVLRQSRRRGWKPSAKQAGIMRRLVAELFLHNGEGDVTLIE